jgi:hypothetical protein
MKVTVHLLLIVIGIVGIVINVLVFLTLSVFKEFRKNTTNIFIGNQTIIDAVASLALATTTTVQAKRSIQLCGWI